MTVYSAYHNSNSTSGVEMTSRCWKFLTCQAKCLVSITNKTLKTSGF